MATEDLLKLSGRLQLIRAQVSYIFSTGKKSEIVTLPLISNQMLIWIASGRQGCYYASELPSEEMQVAAVAAESDEEEEEEVDEMVFGQDSDSSKNSDEDAE